MADINQEIEQIVAEMREVGKQAAPCKGGNYNNLLRYNELRERILSKFLEVFDTGGRLEMPTLTLPNEPLTWSELAEMEGQPVYIVEMGARRYWALVIYVGKDTAYFVTVDDSDDHGDKELYGESWVAYRRPKEGEGKPTEPPNV
jgi:hypothetical protein